ncbi:PHD finger protein 7-like [Sitodiplosis mosellana]|uniref:PHD finger protein 7-like n=1 Tax=Sitodiplosis mosellana TaxID=263140 RepID=UPI0024452B98|nr:PHD finger protein 7-like [Sitodiplosis mosellana]
MSAPLYDSFDGNVANKKCLFCNQNNDDVKNLGDKYSYGEMTLHNFCLLFSANLQQKKEVSEGILGYLKEDIKNEVKRASKLTCYYCKLKGASIGCCRKTCRKSFHLPCALENNCLVQFSGEFDSFCHIHHGIERSSIHTKDEKCLLCNETMKDFHPVTSVELNCCGSKWYHLKCLRGRAHDKQGMFCCPCCDDYDNFRDMMMSNGIYVHEKQIDASIIVAPSNSSDGQTSSGVSSCSSDLGDCESVASCSTIGTDSNEQLSNDLIEISPSNCNVDDIDEEPPAKKKRVHQQFNFAQTFDNVNDAQNYLASQNCWSVYYKTNSDDGERLKYGCNKVKFRAQKKMCC